MAEDNIPRLTDLQVNELAKETLATPEQIRRIVEMVGPSRSSIDFHARSRKAADAIEPDHVLCGARPATKNSLRRRSQAPVKVVFVKTSDLDKCNRISNGQAASF